ncbi:DUF1365 family protein [Mycobacterium sp. M1]|uniref:DUF1365 family protein n=1 Tax=Mycolicibacter acidiphilus TaxID=2835306 RepID=A0ABS5RPC9_9MYCO|nr:DUF1365 family protein [Mycolicibacter acidiphilus]MBS9535902.1 DUF1365 family protein [Mycolicibacter acidiphilus]
MLTPAIYRTEITHRRQTPVHHYFGYRSYSWYIDIDDPPPLPGWLRPFACFNPSDHLEGSSSDTLRQRVDRFLTAHDAVVPGGRITALLQARVLGYVFNPISVFWCHDRDGHLRHVIAEVHNTYGQRHAYLLPPADTAVRVEKQFYVSPFNPVSGHYLVRAPLPTHTVSIDITLYQDGRPIFAATMRGTGNPATAGRVARMQLLSPLAPLLVSTRIRLQGIGLWFRKVPMVKR